MGSLRDYSGFQQCILPENSIHFLLILALLKLQSLMIKTKVEMCIFEGSFDVMIYWGSYTSLYIRLFCVFIAYPVIHYV